MRFDFGPKDGSLQSVDREDPELKALLSAGATVSPDPFPAKINLLIMKDLVANGQRPDMGVLAGYAPGPIGITGGDGKVLIFANKLRPSDSGFDDRMLHVCTHEVGHQLFLAFRGFHMGEIPPSLRQTTAWQRGNAEYHDIGYFPSRPWRLIQFGMGFQDDTSRQIQSLMWPQTPASNVHEARWLRWEDWEEANKKALRYLVP